MSSNVTRERAQEIVETFRTLRIGVLGDMIFDRYIWGTATRISPEAPVPVVKVKKSTVALGGAANVLRNLASLGVKPFAFGVIGDDGDGREMIKLCNDHAIDTGGMVTDSSRMTTVKTRLIANHQQVARIDHEIDHPIDANIRAALTSHVEKAVQTHHLNALIVEDYNKGVISEDLLNGILSWNAVTGLPVALDPHPGHFLDVNGIMIATPNRAEAFALSGEYYSSPVFPIANDNKLLLVANKLIAAWSTKLLLITLGGDGMALFEDGRAPMHIPTVARDVYDVSGAGDTVIATFVAAYLAGCTPLEAAVLSNHAAGVVVGKVGTVPITDRELVASFEP